jgi:sulfite reductase (NADPH) flavoprotein alpha-component
MPVSALPLSPVPLSADQADLLARLTHDLDAQRLWWLSGYAAGLANGHSAVGAAYSAAPATAARPSQRLTIVYGSQTGNARREAERLHADAQASGLDVRLLRADAYPQRELSSERLLYIVISTQGEGDPPDDAIGLVEFVNGKRAPQLHELKYAVLGLGDSSYADFCGIGRRLDARLAELGATRLFAAGEADLDIEPVAGPWRGQAMAHARSALKLPLASATVTALRPPVVSAHSHDHPFPSEVLLNQRISGREFKGVGYLQHGGVGQDVRHLELSLEGSGLQYEPGDALGVWPRNPGIVVEAVLQAAQLEGDSPVNHNDNALALRDCLGAHRELTRLARPFLLAHAERSGNAGLKDLLAQGTPEIASLLGSHQIVDVLRRWPARWEAQALVHALRPLAPRLYSIASSRKRVGDEAHLTLDVLGYEAFGLAHVGAASGFLAALEEGARAQVYVEANERFRVPADASRDIIMVGPGTGVAPFRGFVQERAETGASGRNWLLFGARHFNTGFFYQAEWQQALRDGQLDRLDVAFSRDQAQKIHVQQRLLENGRAVHAWLQGGAHLYVCGAVAMGKDVHAALLRIVSEHAGVDQEAAADYLATLQAEGRYSRDVY